MSGPAFPMATIVTPAKVSLILRAIAIHFLQAQILNFHLKMYISYYVHLWLILILTCPERQEQKINRQLRRGVKKARGVRGSK